MKFFIILSLLFFNFQLFSQSISKQVISTAGSKFDSENSSITFSVGETVVGSMTSEEYSIQLGNGYYPSLDLEALNVELNDLSINVSVFPNPYENFIYLTSKENITYELIILDLNGKLVHKGDYKKNEPVRLGGLSKGTYIARISNKITRQTNSYKIIKK